MRYRRISYRYTMHGPGLQLGDRMSEDLPLHLAEPEWRPPADLYETAEELIVKMEAPGLTEDDFEILLYEDTLVIQGTRNCPMPCGEARVYSMEIRYGPFRLAVRVPRAVDRDAVEARYESGFLYVNLPKLGS